MVAWNQKTKITQNNFFKNLQIHNINTQLLSMINFKVTATRKSINFTYILTTFDGDSDFRTATDTSVATFC